jgi:hypothetical protein
MPVREKPDGWLEPEVPRQPRVSVEREVGVSHAIDGMVAEGPVPARLTPMDAARQRSDSGHHDRGRRRRKLRSALILGAILIAAIPWSLRMAEVAGDAPFDALLGADTLLTGITILKVVMTAAALGAVAWRLRRRASGGRRTGYFAGTWAMALGTGIIAIHESPLTGSLLFDAGAVLLLACAAGDEHVIRRERPSVTPKP